MKNRVTTVYNQAERFAEITTKLIRSGNICRAKKCLAFAEQLFITGSIETKNVISNVYLFSVYSFIQMQHGTISHLFPNTLKTEYAKQIQNAGI